MSLPEKYRYVVVEGPIGAGKTSLARLMSERCGTGLLLEDPEANPFLPRFYQDTERYALPAQLFFLFQRVNQVRALRQSHLFERVTPVPDLVIYLQASTETLIERVRRRAVAYERGMPEEYLARLAETYMRYFYQYSAAPLLIVNSENLNFVDSPGDFDLLLERISAMRGPREFFSLGN